MRKLLINVLLLSCTVCVAAQVRPKPTLPPEPKRAEINDRYDIATIDLVEVYSSHTTVVIRLDTVTGQTEVQSWSSRKGKAVWKVLPAEGLPIAASRVPRFKIYSVASPNSISKVRGILLDRISGLTWAFLQGDSSWDIPAKWEPFSVEAP